MTLRPSRRVPKRDSHRALALLMSSLKFRGVVSAIDGEK
jgi:hypothetical protein